MKDYLFNLKRILVQIKGMEKGNKTLEKAQIINDVPFLNNFERTSFDKQRVLNYNSFLNNNYKR